MCRTDHSAEEMCLNVFCLVNATSTHTRYICYECGAECVRSQINLYGTVSHPFPNLVSSKGGHKR